MDSGSDQTPNVRSDAPANWSTWILIAIISSGFFAQLSRIVQVRSSTGEVPFLSANDRSRWCTIAALSTQRSYEIDEILEIRDPNTRRRTWYSIDLVQHRGPDGKQHFYSSKPPLLPTMQYWVYRAVRATTGLTLMQDTFATARIMLVLINLIPLTLFWCMIAFWAKRVCDNDLACVLITLFIVWGSFLTTFASSLNNHLPGAIAVGLSLLLIWRIVEKRSPSIWNFVVCGLCTSFGVANELPALSWLAAAGAILFIVDWRRTLLGYLPGLLPVAIAFFATNFAAHETLKPAYAHRNYAEKIADLSELANAPPSDLQSVKSALNAAGIDVSAEAVLRPARRDGVLEVWDPADETRLAIVTDQDSGSVAAHRWGDWYDYPGSYWVSGQKQGVDKGEPNRAKYIFHCLLGHHGIFSLTPFWFIALIGCGTIWQGRSSSNFFKDHQLLMMLAVVATSLVSIAFYLARPLEDCNYGGVSSGFRWAFWLSPLWVWLCMHALARGGRRLHAVATCLIALSVFSATFAWSNPWVSPWPMQLLQWLGLPT